MIAKMDIKPFDQSINSVVNLMMKFCFHYQMIKFLEKQITIRYFLDYRLSLELLFKYREQTEMSWTCLPKEFRSWLTSKSECMSLELRRPKPDRPSNRIENQTICSVS